jgi:hypothetical protein
MQESDVQISAHRCGAMCRFLRSAQQGTSRKPAKISHLKRVQKCLWPQREIEQSLPSPR